MALLAVAVLAERPLLGESIHSFTHLQYLPLFWAVVAEIGSMISLALLERRILMLAGHRLSVGRAVAIAYASNAMAQSLPIVGSGAATAFTYRRMVSHGAEPTLAGGPSRWPASRRTSPSWSSSPSADWSRAEPSRWRPAVSGSSCRRRSSPSA